MYLPHYLDTSPQKLYSRVSSRDQLIDLNKIDIKVKFSILFFHTCDYVAFYFILFSILFFHTCDYVAFYVELDMNNRIG